MRTKEPKATTVTAQCVACNARREIEAGEVGPEGVPMCDKCYMPMVAVRASAQLGGGR